MNTPDVGGDAHKVQKNEKETRGSRPHPEFVLVLRILVGQCLHYLIAHNGMCLFCICLRLSLSFRDLGRYVLRGCQMCSSNSWSKRCQLYVVWPNQLKKKQCLWEGFCYTTCPYVSTLVKRCCCWCGWLSSKRLALRRGIDVNRNPIKCDNYIYIHTAHKCMCWSWLDPFFFGMMQLGRNGVDNFFTRNHIKA